MRDTGVGIGEADQAAHLPGVPPGRARSGARRTDGAGLGLTIAREIAQAMGGDITVEQPRSATARPSSSRARLPAAPPGRAGPTDAPPPAAEACRGRVLVAEDDDVNALIVGGLPGALASTYERVADGKQAVGRALRETDGRTWC